MEAKIYGAIIAVMRDCGSIGKDRQASGFASFKFRGIDDVYNALHPVMSLHGVFCVPEVLETTREERANAKGTVMAYVTAKVRFTFYAEDGSSVHCVTVGEAMDSGDKALPKAQSIAMKYAMFQTFCIPTEEMPDPDAETDHLAPKNGATQQRAKAKAENASPMTLEQSKALMSYLTKRHGDSREAYLAELSQFFGRPLSSSRELTKADVSEFLNAINGGQNG